MLTNSPTHDQTFALSMFAGAIQNDTGQDLGLRASKQISQALANAAPHIDGWQIVWGPAVLVQPDGPAYSENLMYVVQRTAAPSQYVIAIAGTNFNSPADWLIEDLYVYKQVSWQYDPLAAGAKIALGTGIGLLNLQGLKPAATLPGAGTTLLDFLRTIVSQKVHITVAGHSLGGALAPTLAVWLADTAQGLVNPWDPKKNATIGAQAFAGPTAGNLAFALHSGLKLGTLLAPVYNTLDVVPHAWQELLTPSLSELPGIYAPDLAPPNADLSYAGLAVLIGAFQLLAFGGGYAPLPNLQSIPGTYDPKIYDSTTPNTFSKWVKQLGQQHVPAYYPAFRYNPEWLPVSVVPRILSPELTALAHSSGSANEFVNALKNRKPRKKIHVGDAVVDAPTGPGDPQADRVAAMVEAAFARQAGASAAK
ncbi:lipase family protein [Nannocystis pusilla]|uniref:Lipase family protein n=1 Tax=Nannocystis pusilla TaxID=889268 RepID=A0ABS7U5X8_9BACT|nr:lipase family protein [Nannocystis pusilla]MBZ5715791.1 lipase family protein [Nannocystis pusilla]